MNVIRYQDIIDGLLMKHYGINLCDTRFDDVALALECMESGELPYEVANRHAEKYELFRTDKHDGYGVPSDMPLGEEDEAAIALTVPDHADLNDKMFESIGKPVTAYDAVEIQGVRNVHAPDDPNGTDIEVDNDRPQFFSVYAHLKEGGVECIGDFGTHARAAGFAKEIGEPRGWPIYDYVLEVFKAKPAPAVAEPSPSV